MEIRGENFVFCSVLFPRRTLILDDSVEPKITFYDNIFLRPKLLKFLLSRVTAHVSYGMVKVRE